MTDSMAYMSPSFTWPSISNVYIKRVCIYIKEGESDKSHVMDGTFTLHLSHKIWCKTSVKLYSNKQTDGLSNFDHGFCVLTVYQKRSLMSFSSPFYLKVSQFLRSLYEFWLFIRICLCMESKLLCNSFILCWVSFFCGLVYQATTFCYSSFKELNLSLSNHKLWICTDIANYDL